MKDPQSLNGYTIYQLITTKDETMRVAISASMQSEIETLLATYRSLQDIPIDKTVRGVFLEGDSLADLSEKQESDITVNQLRELKRL